MTTLKITTRQKITLILIGLGAGILLLEIGLRITGGIFLYFQERANISSLEDKGEYVILCLGESTTFNMYPRFLEKILNERNSNLKTSVIDKGIPGIHTTYILSRLEEYLDHYKPDLVIAMMGVNDREHTEAYVRPSGNDKDTPVIRSLKERKGAFFADLRTYKLARLLYQQIKHSFIKTDHPGIFIREQGSLTYQKGPIVDKTDPDASIIGAYISNQDSRYFLRQGDEYSAEEETEKAVAAYRKAAALDPENIELLHNLALRLKELEKYPDAEFIYRQILKFDQDDYLVYVELGVLSQEQNKPDDVRDFLQKARKIKPGLTRELIRVGQSYRDQGNNGMMERYCKLAIAVDPDNDAGYSKLGLLYVWLNQGEKARKMLLKAIELNPRNADAYASLGIIYERMSQVEKAKEMYKQALDISPGVWDAAYNLIMIYQREGELAKAEFLYKRMTDVAPGNYRTWGALAAFYSSQGKEDLAREYYEKENKLRFKSLNPATIHNYRKLRDILSERGIPLVCLQYPMRPLEELRGIFVEDNGIIFIDNEDVFKTAVKRDGYLSYFSDHFAGDFGHCTPRGNQLLAENIANSLSSLNRFPNQ